MTVANLNVRQILLKRANSEVASTYVGPVGELIIDTTLQTLRIQDGITPGGTLIPVQANILSAVNAAVQSTTTSSIETIVATELTSVTADIANILIRLGSTDSNIANVVGAAPSTLNTLEKIAASLGNNANIAGTINNVQISVYNETIRALAAESALQSNIAQETAARIAALTALEANIAVGIVDDVSAEAAIRAAADASLQSAIIGEAQTRAVADVNLQNAINAESQTRASAVNTLTNNLAAESAARQLADDTEANIRAAADTALQSNITSLANVARTGAYADLTGKPNFSSYVGDIVPDITRQYFLGSPSKRWHSLYLGADSLDIEGTKISVSGGLITGTAPFDLSQSNIAWSNVTSKPIFANVATTGSYNSLTGIPTALSQFANDTNFANVVYVDSKVAALVASAPETLNTLNELANALNNDAAFASNIAFLIGTKADTNSLSDLAFSGNYADLQNTPILVSSLSIVNSNLQVTKTDTTTVDLGNIAGATGPIGYTGSQGQTGFVGSQGSIGFTGSQGIQGLAGNTGAIGPTGATGPIGLTGYTGSRGQDGIIGVDGYTGSQGPQGIAGYTGSQGSPGLIGATGVAGATGPQSQVEAGLISNVANLQAQVQTLESNIMPLGLDGQILYYSINNSRSFEPGYVVNTGIFVETDQELNDVQNSLINYSNVFNSWYRFSHDSTESQPAIPLETTAWQFDSNTGSISSTVNSTTYIGFVSPDSIDNYVLEVRLTSTNSDDDSIAVLVGWYVDENGREYSLSAVRDSGGLDIGWKIIYNYHRNDSWVVIDAIGTVSSNNGWNLYGNIGTKILITRTGDQFNFITTQLGSENYDEVTRLNLDLNSDIRLYKFKGSNTYGFGALSQPFATFEILQFTVNNIYDVRTGNLYLLQAGNWTTSNSSTLFSDYGVGRIITNTDTKKTFFIKNDTEVVKISDFGNIAYSNGGGATGATGPVGYTGSIGSTGIAGATGATGVTGATGATGVTGATGALGYTGSQGQEGLIGYTGSRGSFGFTGSQGIQGNIGFTGSQGIQGNIGFTGSQGNLGYTGSQGDLGYTGSQGVDGYTGSLGYTGSQGDIGYTGSQGIEGYTGSLGYTGSQGDLGYTGSQGTPGEAAAIGYTGSQGDIGYTGSQGIQGLTGATGPVGPLGDTGSTGPIGFTGSQGIIGYTGSQGIQGNIGYTGSLGDTGSTGPIGFTGSQGVVGFTGSRGSIGYTGSDGDDGLDGYTGSQGVIGYTGSLGYTGSQGDTGYTGSQGTPGEAAAIGYTGSQGQQGIQGNIGYTGSQGVIGYTGSQGQVGEIGFPGYTGSDGDNGLDGYTGSQGIQGNIGYTGSAGTDGAVGYTGSQGAIGFTGSLGITGATGPVGPVGPQGTLTARSVVSNTTGTIADGVSANIVISGAKGYALYKISTTAASWVRIYTDSAARTADFSRDELTDPTPNTGIITEVVTTGNQTVTVSPAVIGYNNQDPVTSEIFATVKNKSGGSADITVALTIVPLES